MSSKVAVVTGANRGLGFRLCQRLLEADQVSTIIGGVRQAHLKERALNELRKDIKEPQTVMFHDLDVLDNSSIRSFVEKVKNETSCVDYLFNNAGIFEDGWSESVFQRTMQTNVRAPLALIEEIKSAGLVPKGHPLEVVNVTSGYGSVSFLSNNYKRSIQNANTIDELLEELCFDESDTELKDEFKPTYKVSKAALNRMSELLASKYPKDTLICNAADPGWVRTSMGGEHAPTSVNEGARRIQAPVTYNQGKSTAEKVNGAVFQKGNPT
eukprot:gb/GECG01007926.1/.p1 GENE.gb/GECG01007926.1/~~gb/GECG01007926.1/.p1  ORF type:complete len:269 (+),score=34.07 gb/GECG01007926.1/:1-807(+)